MSVIGTACICVTMTNCGFSRLSIEVSTSLQRSGGSSRSLKAPVSDWDIGENLNSYSSILVVSEEYGHKRPANQARILTHFLNEHAANGMANEMPMKADDFAMNVPLFSYLNGKFYWSAWYWSACIGWRAPRVSRLLTLFNLFSTCRARDRLAARTA